MRKNKSLPDIENSHPDLYYHIQSMGISSISGYQNWCLEQGFSRKLNKGSNLRYQEKRAYQKILAEKSLKEKKVNKRTLIEALKAIINQETCVPFEYPSHFHRVYEMLKPSRSSKFEDLTNRKTLLRLISHVGSCHAKFFDNTPAVNHLGNICGNTYLEALGLVSAYRVHWIRDLESWKPRTHNVRRQFTSLLHHLFVKYDELPPFFDELWFAASTKQSAERRKWFIYVGKGNNIRACKLPVPLTKKMAHLFMKAPKNLSFDHALRWGYMRGLGCGERLTSSLLATRLAESFENIEFWESVIRWFSLHPMLDHQHIGPIIDFIHHQKFVPERILIQDGEREETPAAQPNFSMKGRTPETLLMQVENWHHDLQYEHRTRVAQWDASGIPNYEWSEGLIENGNCKRWVIRELLNTKALVKEGKQLKHCVASYSQSCEERRSSIWTMELDSSTHAGKLLTIEVRLPSRTISQIRGKYNRIATENEKGIIRRWATEAGLRIGKFVM